MSELSAPYLTTATNGHRAVIVPEPPAPLDPRTRALVITLARALQMVVNGLQEYAGVTKRE